MAGLTEAVVRETAPALAEQLARIITNPLVASLMMTMGLLLVLADLVGGGGGIPTIVGVGVMALFFWGHMLAGLAGWEGVALVGLGLVLLGLEVFVIPGFGKLMIAAITGRDYAVVQGAVLVIALIYVTVNLAADILYTLIDPRVRVRPGRV